MVSLRTQNYVVANGVAAGGAPLSLPMLRAALSRVEQSLGSSALKTQVWHAHPSQIQAYEEMGFAKQEYASPNGRFHEGSRYAYRQCRQL